MNEYVYIIQSELGLYKIGRSKHPQKRIKQLQTSSPYKLKLIHTILCNTRPAFHLENRLHSLLRFNKTISRNEWFKLDSSTIDWLLSIKVIDDLY